MSVPLAEQVSFVRRPVHLEDMERAAAVIAIVYIVVIVTMSPVSAAVLGAGWDLTVLRDVLREHMDQTVPTTAIVIMGHHVIQWMGSVNVRPVLLATVARTPVLRVTMGKIALRPAIVPQKTFFATQLGAVCVNQDMKVLTAQSQYLALFKKFSLSREG